MERFASVEQNNVTETVKVSKFASELELEVLYADNAEMTLSAADVSRPGLQLCGFFNYEKGNRVQVMGHTEYKFLQTLPLELRKERVHELFMRGMPCLILTKGLQVEDYIMENAVKYNVPVLLARENSTTFINSLINYLNQLLAQRTQVHGVLMEVLGVGVLICGNSGVGKSEASLDLVKRGNRLVSDDVVILKKVGKQLVGTAPDLIRHFMEVRGIGIINIGRLYGAGAIKYVQELEMIIELEKWDDKKDYERIGDTLMFETILGIKVPKNIIPVTSGRNIANIIETAVMAMRMRYYGYNAAEEIEKRKASLFNI